MDLTFLWKRHEQYIKQRDELNKLISASEKMIQRKIEEIGSLFTRGSSAEEHNLTIPSYASETSSAASFTTATSTGSLSNSTASLSGSSSTSLHTSNITPVQGAHPSVVSTPRPDINTPPPRDSVARVRSMVLHLTCTYSRFVFDRAPIIAWDRLRPPRKPHRKWLRIRETRRNKRTRKTRKIRNSKPVRRLLRQRRRTLT